jgi:hypothetical protein
MPWSEPATSETPDAPPGEKPSNEGETGAHHGEPPGDRLDELADPDAESEQKEHRSPGGPDCSDRHECGATERVLCPVPQVGRDQVEPLADETAHLVTQSGELLEKTV